LNGDRTTPLSNVSATDEIASARRLFPPHELFFMRVIKRLRRVQDGRGQFGVLLRWTLSGNREAREHGEEIVRELKEDTICPERLGRYWTGPDKAAPKDLRITGRRILAFPEKPKRMHGQADTPHTWTEFAGSQLLQNTSLHPIADWGRQRFGSADIAAEKRLAELENTLVLVKLDRLENATPPGSSADIPLPADRALALRQRNCDAGNWRRRGPHIEQCKSGRQQHEGGVTMMNGQEIFVLFYLGVGLLITRYVMRGKSFTEDTKGYQKVLGLTFMIILWPVIICVIGPREMP
jgi:hypothetical protein